MNLLLLIHILNFIFFEFDKNEASLSWLIPLFSINDFSISNNIRLIKLDTEGYELFVLKGGKNILEKTEMIYFEYWDKLTKKYNYTNKEIFSFLKNLGFDVYEVSENAVIKDFDIKSFRLVTNETSFDKNQNLLAINKRLLWISYI